VHKKLQLPTAKTYQVFWENEILLYTHIFRFFWGRHVVFNPLMQSFEQAETLQLDADSNLLLTNRKS